MHEQRCKRYINIGKSYNIHTFEERIKMLEPRAKNQKIGQGKIN